MRHGSNSLLRNAVIDDSRFIHHNRVVDDFAVIVNVHDFRMRWLMSPGMMIGEMVISHKRECANR
jgi:hypothetical protein